MSFLDRRTPEEAWHKLSDWIEDLVGRLASLDRPSFEESMALEALLDVKERMDGYLDGTIN